MVSSKEKAFISELSVTDEVGQLRQAGGALAENGKGVECVIT
jgi:hypothetical protein